MNTAILTARPYITAPDWRLSLPSIEGHNLSTFARRVILPIALVVFTWMALSEPAAAQAINSAPWATFFQSLVTALTGPLGLALVTLALALLFLSWMTGMIDLRTGVQVFIGLVGLGSVTAIAGALWT